VKTPTTVGKLSADFPNGLSGTHIVLVGFQLDAGRMEGFKTVGEQP
jgi:hypothetical protein